MAMMKNFIFSFNLALLLIWVVIFLVIGIAAPSFFNPNYIISVMLKNIVETGMVALPMTLIIVTGGIDLSVGNIMILACMLGGMAAAGTGNGFAGVIVTLIVGAACGLINGLMVAKAKISEMITTLATMYLFLGLARGITGGDSVYAFDFASWCGNTMVGPIPIQLIFFAVMAVIFVIVLQRSTFGRKLFAIGLNKNAARYAGINVEKMQIIIFTVTGIVCALASFVYLGRFTSVKYDAGSNFNLNVITIVVLGGTSIMGGVGDMKGTLLGTLIIATLNSGLTVMNIPINAQTIVQGVVLLISLIAFSIVAAREKQRKVIKITSSEETAAQQ